MTIQQFKYIIAVEELNHFGLAAERCCVTQSTLSTMIGKYEDEIGIKIFDRKTKPVTVTQEGKVLIQQMRIILKETEHLKQSVKALKGEISGEMNMGIIPTAAPYLLPRFLNGFAQKFPQIQFSVIESTTESIVRKIKARKLDIGIVALPLKDDSLAEYPLFNEEFVLYNCFTKRQLNLTNLQDVHQDRFWLLEEGHCLSNQSIKICELQDHRANSAGNFEFRAGSIDSLIRFVRQNKGITLLPYLAILDFNEEDRQKISTFQTNIPARNMGIITHKHFPKQKILKALIKEIQGKIRPLLRIKDEEAKVFEPF